MKYSNVRGVAVILIGFLIAGQSDQANAGWGSLGSYGGSSGVYAAGYGSSGAYASHGSSGYSSYGSYGSSGYAASYGSSGYYGSSGRPTLGERLHAHLAAKRARIAARRAAYGSSGYYASSGGSSGYSSSGGSSGYSSYSYSSSGGSSGHSGAVYSGGSSGSVYSSGVSYGSAGSTSSLSHTANRTAASTASSIVSRVDRDAVYLTVAVPSNAKVFVNGKATTSTGRVREYVSRGLKPGSQYKFQIRAELESTDGQLMSESKNLVVQAGAREQIQFAFAEQAKPIETAVTLNVPEGAEVFLAGNPTSASGATRTFRTSKLMAGESWDEYEIQVRHEGEVKQKSIRLKAGDQLKLTFAFDGTVDGGRLAAR